MKKVVVLFSVLFTPFITFGAALGVPGSNLGGFFTWATTVMSSLTILFLSAAVVFFLWGVLQFVMSAGDDEAREKGKSHIIWGVIGITVMISVWALVTWLTSTLGLTVITPISAPTVQQIP